MNRIRAHCPELSALYRDIYEEKGRGCRSELNERMQACPAQEGLPYVRDDDSARRPFDVSPVVVNCFFHEEIIPSAKRKGREL